jgi:hypothetical protein
MKNRKKSKIVKKIYQFFRITLKPISFQKNLIEYPYSVQTILHIVEPLVGGIHIFLIGLANRQCPNFNMTLMIKNNKQVWK